MITMDKFKKRLAKASKHQQNALVIGTGFNRLADLLDIYKTVFIFSNPPVEIKARNLIRKETIESTLSAIDVSVIFIDLDCLHLMPATIPLWHRWKPLIMIEGNDPIGRDKSQELYKNHYRCIELQGVHHIWKSQL